MVAFPSIVAMCCPNVYMHVQITEDDQWRIFQFSCAAGSGPAQGLRARVMVSKWQPSTAEIRFDKMGSLSDADVDIVTSTMRAANTIINQVRLWVLLHVQQEQTEWCPVTLCASGGHPSGRIVLKKFTACTE